jgi:hypothetical protein
MQSLTTKLGLGEQKQASDPGKKISSTPFVDTPRGSFVWVNDDEKKVPLGPSTSMVNVSGASSTLDVPLNRQSTRWLMGIPKKFRGGKGKPNSLPPPIQGTIVASHIFRYRAVAAAANSISIADMLFAMGSMGVTTTSVFSLASSFRLKSVTIWPPQVSAADVVFVEWATAGSLGYVKDDEKITAIPDGITVTTALTFVPPRGSIASDWVSSGASTGSNYFNLTSPAGTIIDMSVDFTIANAFANVTFSVSSATPGHVYFSALDGFVANNLIPIGLSSTH